MSLPPKPPVFWEDATQHRRQIADYCRAVGDAVGEQGQIGFEYVLQGTSGETPTAGGWTRETLTGSNRTLRFHVEDEDGKDRTGAWGLVKNGDRLVISNADTDKSEIYDATADATTASSVVTISCTEVLVSTAFVVGDVGYVTASAIGASDASTVTYTQNETSDWSQASPTVVSSSLDELASRTKTVEDSLPQDASVTTYTPGTSEDWIFPTPSQVAEALDNLADNQPIHMLGSWTSSSSPIATSSEGFWNRSPDPTNWPSDLANVTTLRINAKQQEGRDYSDDIWRNVRAGWQVMAVRFGLPDQFERYRVTGNGTKTSDVNGSYWDFPVRFVDGPGVGFSSNGFTTHMHIMAGDTAYFPSTSGDWRGTDPSTMTDALDRLAARTRDIHVTNGLVQIASGNQSLTASTWTKIAFATVVYDDQNLWNSTNNYWDFSGLSAPPTGWHYEVNLLVNVGLENTGNQAVSYAIGVAEEGTDPTQGTLGTYVGGEIARRQDNPFTVDQFQSVRADPAGFTNQQGAAYAWTDGSSVVVDGTTLTNATWFSMDLYLTKDTFTS